MQRNLKLLLIILVVSVVFNSCKNSNYKDSQLYHNLEKTYNDKLIVTNKIMYDVPIINNIIGERSKNNPDWFWNNIPIPQDEIFIKSLLEDIKTGKFKIYRYDILGSYDSFDEIPENDLQSFFENAMSYKFDISDTSADSLKNITTEIKLDYSHVKMFRFLEEWYIDEGKFYKKVIAIAPFFTINHPLLENPMNIAKFWVLVDSERNTE